MTSVRFISVLLVFSAAACANLPTVARNNTSGPVVVYSTGDEVMYLDRAIKDWNGAVGCTVLVRSKELSSNVDVVVEKSPVSVVHDRLGGYSSAEKRIRIYHGAQGDALMSYRVVMHELGHALGLSHDLREGSVMNLGGATGLMDDRSPSLTVMPSAASALRGVYCGK